MADPGQRGGKRVAPRHAGPRRAEPARLDTTRLPPLDDAGQGTVAEPPRGRGQARALLGLALGITAAVVAWGYLVYLAIDFGTAARDGDAAGWWLLVLATIGAIACLFVALMLGTRLVARLRDGSTPPAPPRPPGGRRAAR